MKITVEDETDGFLENYPGIRQCAHCGIFDHVGSPCVGNPVNPNDELAYNRWADVESAGVAAHTVPLEDDRVLMLHPAVPPAFHTPLTITCGAKQVQTCLEPTTFDPQGRTLISIHLMLAAKQLRRPTLTLAKLWVEISLLCKRVEMPHPKEWYVPGGTILKPYRIDLYPANDMTIKTFGLAEQICFQLGGYELETNFVVVDDAMGVEDFLLGCNFLRAYQVLVDLTSMKIVVRELLKPVWHHAHTQVGDASVATPVALDSDLVLQPFERTVVKAKLITNELEPLIFQNVILNAATADTSLHNVVFLEDSVATVSEARHVFISAMKLTSNPQRIRKGTRLGNVVPVSLV